MHKILISLSYTFWDGFDKQPKLKDYCKREIDFTPIIAYANSGKK